MSRETVSTFDHKKWTELAGSEESPKSRAVKVKIPISIDDLSPNNKRLIIRAIMFVDDKARHARLMGIITRANFGDLTLEAVRTEISWLWHRLRGPSHAEIYHVLKAIDEAIETEVLDRTRAVQP